MHYVLIWWFKEVVTPMLKGYAGLVVYADDFVVTFQYKSDAVWFYEHLKHRMGHFGLSLEEEKSRLIEFGRYAKERCSKSGTKPGTFTFLGFTHYCSKSKNGRFRVKRKTSSLIDANVTEPGDQYQELNETYVIFITENDVLGENLPIYHFDRIIRETGKMFNDESHIIYVNSQIKDETALGKLMHDFPVQMRKICIMKFWLTVCIILKKMRKGWR